MFIDIFFVTCTPDGRKKIMTKYKMPVIQTLLRRSELKDEALTDPVSKFRVSQPETLIDTDFEYGLQPTKWETMELINNIPTFFSRSGDDSIALSDVTCQNGSALILVTCSSAHNLVVGSPIIIFGLNSISAEGTFFVLAVNSTTQFTYKAKQKQTLTGSIFDSFTSYLYPGRIFQSTQFNLDNIVSMDTDNLDLSKITVKTKYPHGFNTGTYFMLINSVGRKRVAFNSAEIDPNDFYTYNYDITTTDNNPDGSGFTLKKVVPYDFQSKKTLFFNPINVNTTTYNIAIANHGLKTNDTVMYVCPAGDTPVGGLTNYKLYAVTVVDINSIYLRNITSTLRDGLLYKRYTGYFNDNPAFFDGVNSAAEGIITDILNITSFPTLTYSSTNVSIEVIGWFRPSVTGQWTFSLNTDDASYLWLGDNAVSGYTTANAVVKNGGLHAATKVSYTTPTSLTAGQYYPIRIQYGQNLGAAEFTFTFSGPGGITERSNLVGHFFTDTPSSPSFPFYQFGTTKVALSSQGTGTFGRHALMKAHVISALNPSGDTLQLNMNTSNYLDSSLGANDPVVVFSGEVGRSGFATDNIRVSTNNVSSSSYRKYYVRGNPIVGATTTNIQISDNPGGAGKNIIHTYLTGLSWIIPITNIAEYDSFYAANHGMVTDEPVVYTIVSGSGPVGIVAGTTYYIERVNANQFRLKSGTGNSPTMDVQSIGSGVIRFSRTIANPAANTIYSPGHDLLNNSQVSYDSSIYPSIGGLISGNFYYVINATANTFALTTVQGSTANIVNFTGIGTGEHYIYSTDKATDGNYSVGTILDPYTFALNAGFKIPYQSILFKPQELVILNTSMFYLPNHRMRTGAMVIYRTNGNNPIGGLVDGNTYYVIRIDLDYFRLSNSFENADNNIFISIASIGTGLQHQFDFTSVCGELYINNAVDVSLASPHCVVTARTSAGIDFLATTRVGDKVRFVVPSNTPTTTFGITAVDSVTGILTLNASHLLTDGDFIFYSGLTPIAGYTNNFIYYVRVSGLDANQVILYKQQQDAVNNVEPVIPTNSTIPSGNTLVRKFPNSIFDGEVYEVRSSSVIQLSTAPTQSLSGTSLIVTTGLYPRADGYILHRPYDGGVEIIPSNNPDAQIIRQTRKYFRYQSGKGTQISKAVNFSAPTELESLSRSGTTAYAYTRRPHRLTPGLVITIADVAQSQQETEYWNGTYVVQTVPDFNQFTFTLRDVPPETVAGGFPSFTVQSWTNSRLRVGMMDDQNGLFYEYDGSDLYCVRRSSVKQLPGTCSVQFNNAMIQGSNTKYTSQLVVGDRVVIKGMTYKVVYISNDTVFYVQPPYRGINASAVTITKTQEVRVPQSQWSIDVCDGTGPTGYNLNIHRIQMAYLDYSWYGAGKVRFGFKDSEGQVRYIHEFIHNNVMTEAYLRSGNLPGRYEVASIGVPTYVPALMHWGTSVIMDGRFDDDRAYLFTAAGVQLSYGNGDTLSFIGSITSQNITTTYNIYDPTLVRNVTAWRISASSFKDVQNIRSGTRISGTGIADGTVTVGSPLKSGATAAFIYIDKAPTQVVTNGNMIAGDASDFIPATIPLVSIRLAPSVDNGRPGALGSREIINRMQLILKSIGILTTHDTEIKLLLNGYPFTKSWQRVTPPSLSQLLYHVKGDSVVGGTQFFNFRVNGGSVDTSGRRSSTSTTNSLEELATLGNSVIGGDDVFPNGPDLLTIAATILDGSGIAVTNPYTITCRITWTESQA